MSKSLRELRELALVSLQPNENLRGHWKAGDFSKDEAMIAGPAYRHDPRRRLLIGTIRMDGLTTAEASARSRAVADFVVAAVNAALDLE